MSGGKKYTYFDSFGDSTGWIEGQETPDLEVEESTYNGQVQYMLKKPNKTAQLEDRLKLLEDRMDRASKVISDLISNPNKPW